MLVATDLAAWPVAVLTRGSVTRREVPACETEMPRLEPVGPVLGALLDRRERFGLVLDLGRQSTSEQEEFGGWLRTNGARVRRYVVGCALVVPPAAVARGRELIGARPDLYPFPAWVAGSVDECRTWVEGVLASSGPARRRRRP